MCLIAFAWKADPSADLIVAANRDEAVARRSTALHVWNCGIIAGRDEQAGGTWMGFNPDGDFCAITNIRGSGETEGQFRSRGEIVVGALRAHADIEPWLARVRYQRNDFRAFNLVYACRERMWIYESPSDVLTALAPGVYALSNGAFGSPWPKCQRAMLAMRQAISLQRPNPRLWATLADRSLAATDALPKSDLSPLRERALSANFVCLPHYQTVSSSVAIRQGRRLEIEERRWSPEPAVTRLAFGLRAS